MVVSSEPLGDSIRLDLKPAVSDLTVYLYRRFPHGVHVRQALKDRLCLSPMQTTCNAEQQDDAGVQRLDGPAWTCMVTHNRWLRISTCGRSEAAQHSQAVD
jgi:hypothetical protein